ILNKEGILKGFNTDVNGFILSLKEEGISIKNKKFLILGAGGASKAIVYGILKEGGKVYIYNRTISKAIAIKEKFKDHGFIEIVEVDKSLTENIDIIVNATSLGLKKDDPMPLNPELIKPEHVYCDIVYPETPLMKEAERIGCKVIGGIGMLLWQAAFAFKIWTEVEAPIDIMRKTLDRVLTKG
ncbi:MAG: hypothetical protein NZ826_05605, partial [Thermodesulfovibrio sp.]|nr:hypothetical protein [Thermodesulfovibrio sp.]